MYRITKYPESILTRRLKDVTEFQNSVSPVTISLRNSIDLKQIADDMIATMHGARGIGIAASQVGLDLRMAIISANGEPGTEIVIINPEIIECGGWEDMAEGCLSYPHITGHIRRRSWVNIRYYDITGQVHELEADGMLGKCIQHEIDHLNGVTIYDRMQAVDRFLNRRQIEELRDQYKERQNL